MWFRSMPQGLLRYHESGQPHFITFSCYRRKPKFADAAPAIDMAAYARWLVREN